MSKDVKLGNVVASRREDGRWVSDVVKDLKGNYLHSWSLDNLMNALKDITGIRQWRLNLDEGTVTSLDSNADATRWKGSHPMGEYKWWEEENTTLDGL